PQRVGGLLGGALFEGIDRRVFESQLLRRVAFQRGARQAALLLLGDRGLVHFRDRRRLHGGLHQVGIALGDLQQIVVADFARIAAVLLELVLDVTLGHRLGLLLGAVLMVLDDRIVAHLVVVGGSMK